MSDGDFVTIDDGDVFNDVDCDCVEEIGEVFLSVVDVPFIEGVVDSVMLSAVV